MAWVGRDLKDHRVPVSPALERVANRSVKSYTRLPRAPSNLAFNTSRDGASTASLGSLLQHLNTLSVETFSLLVS